jgi:hypothetical protein
MALSSPGVQVSVIDESFYTPSEPGTVPLIVIATAANKQNGAGTGVATGTLASNADTLYLMTSQRDLVDTFGDPIFKTDASNNPIHGGEQNEYGLQAAYSYLGVSNRAFVLRANVDLSQLDASATAPSANPANGTWWLDTSNTKWGIFEWNSDAATVGGNGQKFINKVPLVITDTTKVVDFAGQDYTPKGSVGAVGAYAVVAVTTTLAVYYKNRSGTWVQVGSNDWFNSWPVVSGTASPTTVTGTITINVNDALTTLNPSGASLTAVAGLINNANIESVSAAVVNSKLEIYSDGTIGSEANDSSTSNIITLGGTALTALGITAGNYLAPRLLIQPHTTVPDYKRSDNSTTVNGRPTGSVWVKTTTPNLGANLVTKRYNSATDAWETVAAPLYATGAAALAALDPTGGGANLAVGALYSKFNIEEENGADLTPRLATFKLFRRNAVGATTITSAAVTASTFTAGTNSFVIAESLVGDDAYSSDVTVTFTANGNVDDADDFANAVNSAGLTNVTASVDNANRVIITHATGGDILIGEGTNTPFNNIFATSGVNATANLYDAATGDATHDYVATQWRALSFEASATEVTALAEDQQLWYNSIVDEVDIMINDGTNWVGYKTSTSPFFAASAGLKTDPAGPIISATEPTEQSDGSALVNGDLWIDTSDIDNYPVIYKFNSSLPVNNQWVLIDKTDQSSEDGVLFADARYNTAGANSDEPGLITDLLDSNYVDPDCPQPALYPKGMLLWNLRRSGFNVKKFVRNHIDLAAYNTLVGAAPGEYMSAYYPHRWVSEAANQVDGSGTFGRKAQRAVVIQGLQAVVNSNQTVRDSDSRVFNLIACPGYPELIGELITLNYDRGLTAFVVADTPARLNSSATSLLAWGNNDGGAAQDDDLGAVSFDEYAAMYYPWGFSSDNFGNNIVVPPSHMMLRTISLNDQVAYPWFAPAGTRRGGITNATSVGYITSEGEFETVALNEGQRDTLASIKVNPLTFLSGAGLVAFGQYTRARNASALDRVNVARLIVYLRRQLNLLAKPYLFEPNDKATRAEIKNACESLMLELVGQRALYDFLVVCDESNNTPARIDRNELYVDIAIEPIKAVEFIYIPLRIKNTGEISGL